MTLIQIKLFANDLYMFFKKKPMKNINLCLILWGISTYFNVDNSWVFYIYNNNNNNNNNSSSSSSSSSI